VKSWGGFSGQKNIEGTGIFKYTFFLLLNVLYGGFMSLAFF
jgi:hypothetical protein